MPTKIRLQRQGKKRSAFYHIVIADNRAPRDGKFIEKIGTYNPNTNPATIDLSFEKALDWVKTGAQPTDTVRAILSYEGVLYKNHLDIGVKKGAFSEDEATKRFDVWKTEKMNKIQQKIEGVSKATTDAYNAAIKAEEEVNSTREAAILAKSSALAEEARAVNEAAAAAAAGSSSLGISVIATSRVKNIDATDAANSRAERVTFLGSMIIAFTRSSYVSVSALYPLLPFSLDTLSITTSPSTPALLAM